MSSADSGRYQSRLFKFFHTATQRFTHQCDRAFRQIKFTTSGVAAVVMYPLYLLFQPNRNSAKQFYQAAPQGLPDLLVDNNSQPLTPPTADTPIQRVLLLVNASPSQEATSTPAQAKKPSSFAFFAPSLQQAAARLMRFKLLPNRPINTLENTDHSHLISNTSVRPVIRGIATNLSSRTLVLITAQNEIIDILTPEQQEIIQEQIIGEVAEYWRYQRLLHSAREITAQLQLDDKTRGQARNLPPTPHPLVPSQALGFLDRVVAELESKQLTPLSKAASTLSQHSKELVQKIQLHISASLSRGASPTITADGAETQTIRIQTLIWAAIDYFFGDRRYRKHLKQTTPPANSIRTRQHKSRALDSYTVPAPRYQLASNIQDPWLTLSDLFGDSDQVDEPATTINPAVGKNKALPATQSVGYYVRQLLNKFQNSLQSQSTSKGKLVEKDSTKRSPVLVTQNQSAIALHTQQPQAQSTWMEPAPDWIEINATTMGYVKHPLEQLLEWLDRAMLWLEEVLINVWQRIQRWWQGK